MKALSIRQPWAWLIVHGYKPVENRTWRPAYRGQLLIHAGQKFDKEGYLWVLANTEIGLDLPPIHDFLTEPGYRGGIVGQAELYDVTEARFPSHAHDYLPDPYPWFFGPHGLWLRDAKVLPFHPCRGQLGIFEFPFP